MTDNTFTDVELTAYLDESASPGRITAIEDALRDDEALRERLAEVVARRDAGLHSLGEIWRRRRLTCPTREQLGSYLLGVLPDDLMEYIRFHLEVVQCPLCLASIEDLRKRHAAEGSEQAGATRRKRYYQSSVGRLTEGAPGE